MNTEQRKLISQVLISGFLLWFFAIIATLLVSVTENQTRDKIHENERLFLLKNLYALLPPEKFNNDIAEDFRDLPASVLLGTSKPARVYRARLYNQPIAAVINSIAPDGYSGKIHLLVGIYKDGSLAAVRVVKHKETPGLGDGIELRKSDWILGFNGKSLDNPASEEIWKVKRDGGEFDQFTGATITPRAIVKAVRSTLLYYQQNNEQIFQIYDKQSGNLQKRSVDE